jgi:hypothetical protein
MFGEPWHFPPAWGDIPTWLAFIAAAVAGSAALIQLSQQQKQIAEEAARNVQRDELLRTQLTEAAQRISTIRRQQAEQVGLTGFRIQSGRSGSGRTEVCEITNGSLRPIRAISCRMLTSGNVIKPIEFRIGEKLHSTLGTPGPGSGLSYLLADQDKFDLDDGKYHHLLASQVIRVTFPSDADETVTVEYVIRFTDDADARWQLDSDMHLSAQPDALW